MSRRVDSPRIGNYEIGVLIGKGAQGEVFRARNVANGQLVALKTFRLGTDEHAITELRRRVTREVAALRKVQHECVVRVTETGEIESADPVNAGYLWIAYDLIEGSDLGTLLTASPDPSAEDAVNLISFLCAGLREAHEKEIIHRDIKPSNVRLRNDDWNQPVLVDFGCARVEGASSLTQSIAAMGTYSYMAPEVIKSAKNASGASDQWSVARLATDILSVTLGGQLETVHSSGAVDLVESSVAPSLPTVADCLIRALGSAPSSRYSSVETFRKAFVKAAVLDNWITIEVDGQRNPYAMRRGEALTAYLARMGLNYVDVRHVSGGNLWVIKGREAFKLFREELALRGIRFDFAMGGGKQSGGKPAWFTKAKA